MRFEDASLLEEALVHSSYVNEHPGEGLASNERLEFLGDAVVSLIISRELWLRHPTESEGHLTTRRAAIVSTRGLARVADRLDLGASLLVGQGADRSGERRRGSVLAASLEALLAAIYLDRGLDEARRHLVGWVDAELADHAATTATKPAKSLLQEQAFAATRRPPHYQVVSAMGPDHAKSYVVDVSVGGELLGRGSGKTRREAETEAAEAALKRMDEPVP